jgi:hypothetical protein
MAMRATTMGALIDHLQRHYKWDEVLLVNILTEEDYLESCGDTTIPWERGAEIVTQGGLDWLNPEIQNSIAQIIGEEEER